MTSEADFSDGSRPMKEDVEWPFCRDRRIQLFQGPRSRVARIGKDRVPCFFSFAVHLLKGFQGKKNLTANFQSLRRFSVPLAQRQGNRANSFQIECNILAVDSIPTGRSEDETPVIIDELHSDPVNLRFYGVFDRLDALEKTSNSVVELFHFFSIDGVVQ